MDGGFYYSRYDAEQLELNASGLAQADFDYQSARLSGGEDPTYVEACRMDLERRQEAYDRSRADADVTLPSWLR